MDNELYGNDFLQKITLNNREMFLKELDYMRVLVSGRADVWFCNNFIGESVELLINSIFLMEAGYFDCAFYSIRQSAETLDNMLFLASDKGQLSQWKSKGRFPPDSAVKKMLANVDSVYNEIKGKLTLFFEEFDDLIKACHKIVHKQGFDTFYKLRVFDEKGCGLERDKELELFDKLLRYSICRLYIFCIILDPICLVLTDNDLDDRLDFDPMTTPIRLEFIKKNYSTDLISLIKETNFYKELVGWFADKEKMNPYIYNVVREYFFDLEHLNEIEDQRHLLNITEQFIFDILKLGLKVSEFHVGGISIVPYRTTISSNYDRHQWNFIEFDEYVDENDVKFNIPYQNVYLSYVHICGRIVFLQHNDLITDIEQELVLKIYSIYKKQYDELQIKLKQRNT